MATARLPARLGKATLAPSASLGIGWLHTERDEEGLEQQYEQDPDCLPQDPTNPDECRPTPVPPYVYGDGFNQVTVGLRSQLAITLSMAITEQVSVELGVGVDLVPTAHGQPFVHPETLGQLGPDVNQLPPEETGVGLDPARELPGEPDHFTWWGIGLRVGAW
jgi:hypothetical protein